MAIRRLLIDFISMKVNKKKNISSCLKIQKNPF